MPLIDILILLAVGFFVYTRFFGHKLPKDLTPRTRSTQRPKGQKKSGK